MAAVERLISRREPVTFAEIQRLAGVSSWFVYNNGVVRAAIEAGRDRGPHHHADLSPMRADVAGLRADLSHARDEIHQLREERDRLRQRVRQGLGAVLEQRELLSVIERAEAAERQRSLLQLELQEARVQLSIAQNDVVLLREELTAARRAVKQMMRAV